MADEYSSGIMRKCEPGISFRSRNEFESALKFFIDLDSKYPDEPFILNNISITLFNMLRFDQGSEYRERMKHAQHLKNLKASRGIENVEEAVEVAIQTTLKLDNQGNALTLPTLSYDRLAQRIERFRQVDSQVVANAPLINDVLGVSGRNLVIYGSDVHPDFPGEFNAPDKIGVRPFLSLSKGMQAHVDCYPSDGEILVVPGSFMANRLVRELQGRDPDDPTILAGPPVIDELISPGEYPRANIEMASGYINGILVSEPNWSLNKRKTHLMGMPEIDEYRPEVHQAGDGSGDKNAGFVKNDELIVDVIKKRGMPSIIIFYGIHASGTKAMECLLTDTDLLLKLERFLRRRPEGSFQIRIHVETVNVDHERQVVEVQKGSLHFADFVPIGIIDDSILMCIEDCMRDKLPTYITSDGLRTDLLLGAEA